MIVKDTEMKIPMKCSQCDEKQFVERGDERCPSCEGTLNFHPYKGDGITSCKWCGGTGKMNTWGNDGRLLFDTDCWFCKEKK